MAVSVLALGIATFAYAHPDLSSGSGRQSSGTAAGSQVSSYQLAAVDFVDPSTGWVVAELPSSVFAVLHTTDAGRTWVRQLSGTPGDDGEYVKFFDRQHGVVVLLGAHSVLFQTLDGGKTWSRDLVQEGGGYVVSAAFADARHGWLLVEESNAPGAIAETLFRTTDAGRTWDDEGDPVPGADWAFRVVFGDPVRGWLYTLSSGAYAYTTADGGGTWRRILLTAPTGGWPVAPAGSAIPETFFVAAHPTVGSGVVATVVPIAPPQGRSVDGGIVLGYPPLRIRGFDGGILVTSVYTTFGDISLYRYSATLWESGDTLIPPAPGEVELSSLDAGSSWKIVGVPLGFGTIGFANLVDWWWIGADAWATSPDAGATWNPRPPTATLAPLPGSLQVIDADHAWYAGMKASTPYLEATYDGGRTWRTVGLPGLTPTPA
jgi:photosystem II stability/assembly factor-like uncharacterized protein